MVGKADQKKVRFIDLFAGCGGLSEGFIQLGCVPVSRVEMDATACRMLKTHRACYRIIEYADGMNG